LFDGVAAFLGGRELAARIGIDGEAPGIVPAPIDGLGPPFLAPVAPSAPVRLRLTNTGTTAWPAGVEVAAGWEVSELPYLAAEPATLSPLPVEIPALAPGESVVVEITLPDAPVERSIAWVTLRADGRPMSEIGSAALQVVSQAD
ncbi:MAG TPA: hypothetical protein VI277_09640, partial [Candidatus Limnocylindria bacterium]